jgi:flagellin-like hook-associated protein FlgL
MINTNTSVASLLSNIYSSNNAALTASMSKIASGKRVATPGDDFAAWIRASGQSTDVAGYKNIKQDLQEAKALVDYGKGVGNTIMEDLTRLKELADLYGQTSDTDKQASYTAEYDTIVDRITAAKAGSYYDTTQVYQAGALTTVNINTEGAQNVSVTTTAIGDETAVNDITTATTGGIQNEINNANTYVAEMESFSKVLDRNLNLTDTIISSKNATISALVDVDEVEELGKVTNLQVRQAASVAMMSQANVSQAGLARLFM